ncbi:hypothetical protein ACNQQN_24915 [Mycobacteroides chelonae]|uniref:hypothetical protein n=1 Tax=Mycobacteroides chelonae TaxID=1774 RepID=UPI003AAB0C86
MFEGQTLKLALQWTGASATAGSNPVKVGFTPFDASGNPFADVIRGFLQPSGDHAAMGSGGRQVARALRREYVLQLLILDSGATAGTFCFRLIGLGVELAGPRVGQGSARDGGCHWRVGQFRGSHNRGSSTGDHGRWQDHRLEIVGLIQQVVSGLAIIQTVINQILDILNGNIVTPINSLVQGVIKDWFGLNQNKTQKLTSGGGISVAYVTGNFGMNRVADLVDNLGDMLTGVKTGADGTATGTTGTIGEQIDQAKESRLSPLGLSRDALKSAIAAQTTLQEQETEQTAVGTATASPSLVLTARR